MKCIYTTFSNSSVLLIKPRCYLTICLTMLLCINIGCANLGNFGNTLVTELGNINIFTDEEETKLGKEFVAKHNKKIVFHNDPVVTNYIDELGQHLVKYSKRKNINYTFRVVETKGVNAYAIPGGYIYIHLDLIRAAKNESELAAVIGHEIGHIVGQHSMKRLTQVYSIELIKQLILEEDSSKLKKLVTEVLAAGLLFRYSRDHERESDAYGVQNIYDAGISPDGAATFFETLQTLQKREPTALEKFISTHPVHSERISNVRSQIKTLPVKSGLRNNSSSFQLVKNRIGS